MAWPGAGVKAALWPIGFGPRFFYGLNHLMTIFQNSGLKTVIQKLIHTTQNPRNAKNAKVKNIP
jgi:hypothetical protein